MRRVKVLYLHEKGLDFLWQRVLVEAIGDRHDLSTFDETRPMAGQFEGVEVVIDMGGSVGTHEMMDAATDARLWQVYGTGIEHVDIAYMKSKGFMVTNCSGVLSGVALAESAMMHMLMLARRYHEATENFKSRVRYLPAGNDLEDKVLAVVGFGGSGQQLARRAKAFDMRVYGIDVREIEPEVLAEIRPDFMGTPADLDLVLAGCDYLSLHLHVTDETRGIIDARRIGIMKPTACIINVARGALVDEEAMYTALLEGTIGGAGLDVFAAEPPDPTLPVYQLPNVYVTPHVAGDTTGTARKRAGAMAENVDRIALGLELLSRVDL